MNLSRRPLLSLLLPALLALLPQLTWAQSADDLPKESRSDEGPQEQGGREWRAVPRAQRASSLSDAVRRVQRESGGQVLGAERVQFDGRDINRVKVIDDRGRVRYFDDDPQRRQSSEDLDRAPRARRDNPQKP